jgi:ABC-2 type transport system permease protein
MKRLFCSPLWRLTTASVKMYFRNFTAVFFSLLFPIIFLLVFGFVGSSNSLSIDVAYINQSESVASQAFDSAFRALAKDDTLDKTTNEARLFRFNPEISTLVASGEFQPAIDLAREKLTAGDLTAAVIVPVGFGDNGQGQIQLLVDAADTQFAGVVTSTIDEIAAGFNDQLIAERLGGSLPQPFTVTSESVQSSALNNIDYLVPGIIAFSVMSLGLFSVSQGCGVCGSLR